MTQRSEYSIEAVTGVVPFVDCPGHKNEAND